jgi:hypothetical protein
MSPPDRRSIKAESVRGRGGIPPRGHVVLPVGRGFAVFDVATGRRLSDPAGKTRALEAFGAIETGLVLVPFRGPSKAEAP